MTNGKIKPKHSQQYVFISLQGNFGDVFRGIYKPDKLEVAVKTCRETLSEEAKKKFLQEGRILKQYDHPNIVKFVGIAATRQPVMIVMEYVPGKLSSRCNQIGCVLDRDRDRHWDRCYVETIHTGCIWDQDWTPKSH